MSTTANEPKVREVRPGFYILHLPLPMRPTIVNVTLVDGGRGEWALLDTGMGTAQSLEAFRAALAEVGCAPEKIAKIVCTHHHPDHFGASAPQREMTGGAAVYLHPAERARIPFYLSRERPAAALAFYERLGFPMSIFDELPTAGDYFAGTYRPATPDHALADGDRIAVGEREIHVVWTPGHTAGHCVLHFAREKIAVVGDHLLPKITPHIGINTDGEQDPLGDFLQSLRKVGELDVETVLPAHGGVYHDHRKRVAQLLDFHAYRLEVVLDALGGRWRETYDVALEAFGLTRESTYQQQFPATYETLAHLERLRREDRVERAERDGRILWRPRRPQ